MLTFGVKSHRADREGQNVNAEKAAQEQPEGSTCNLGNNPRTQSRHGMGQRMFDGAAAFFQQVEGTFHALSHAAARRTGTTAREARERVRGKSSPAAAHAATVNAANAEDEDASPAPAGKLLCEVTLAFAAGAASVRMRSRCATTHSRAEPCASTSSIVHRVGGQIGAKFDRRRRQRGEVHRKRRIGGQAQGIIAVAPVFDECNVRMCDGCFFSGLHQTCLDSVSLCTALYRKRLVLN